jgi:hypothetical protein
MKQVHKCCVGEGCYSLFSQYRYYFLASGFSVFIFDRRYPSITALQNRCHQVSIPKQHLDSLAGLPGPLAVGRLFCA